jgi:dienelactone hydrolase
MNATIYEKVIQIPADGVNLTGDLIIPEDATGLIIFSHGSGSSRLSPRNNYVAHMLQEKGFATLLFDLLTEEEDRLFVKRFNIPLLTRRLEDVTKWVQAYPATAGLNIGYFGASTGAASALRAAAHLNGNIKAIVSRGGRPDLAMELLDDVDSPTLLIVGGRDDGVIQLNQKALRHLAGERRLAILEGASHLFGEPGKLEEVAELTAEWFGKYI